MTDENNNLVDAAVGGAAMGFALVLFILAVAVIFGIIGLLLS